MGIFTYSPLITSLKGGNKSVVFDPSREAGMGTGTYPGSGTGTNTGTGQGGGRFFKHKGRGGGTKRDADWYRINDNGTFGYFAPWRKEMRDVWNHIKSSGRRPG